MEPMTTLSEITNKLWSDGYVIDFNVKNNSDDHGSYLLAHPDEFIIDKHYRFEGPSDPGDEAVVYAISSKVNKIKGILVDGYGISSDKQTDDLLKQLKEKDTTNNDAANE